MNRAAWRTRSRTSSGVSMRRSIGSVTPTKIRRSPVARLAEDLEHALAVRLAGELDVEVSTFSRNRVGSRSA